ncbi:MAG TPA: hypothetical protein GX005_03660 [Bacteroidales bacterium]|nr:hypothetical protein [Bacteroidales bacterium]
MTENSSNHEFNLQSTISFISKHKLILISTFFLSAIAIGLLSLLLPNYYKSQVALMPADSNAVSKAVLSQMDNYDVLSYGKEKDAEYLLELLGSGTIISKTVSKFKLDEHYGIKEEQGKAKSDKLNQRLVSNIKAKRTENLGVKLTVWDTDPQYAADIANYMTEQMQILRNDMKRAKMDSIVNALTASRDGLVMEIGRLADSMSRMTKEKKVFNPDMMSDRMSQEMAKQIALGNNAGVKRLEDRLGTIGESGPQIISIREQLKIKIETLKVWDEKLEQVRVDAKSNIPTDFIIDNAYPADLKDKPKRSIIALVGGICCTLIAFFVLILRDKNKALKK